LGDKTAIEWSEATWNPLAGCTRVSSGCTRCYAERTAYRLAAMGNEHYLGLTKKVGSEIRWTGEVRLVESALDLPLRWKKPRRIFVNSMSDLFHESVKDEWIAAIFAVMFLAGQHTYQILTKRPERMRNWMQWLMRQPDQAGVLLNALGDLGVDGGVNRAALGPWPKSHIWFGVSAEDQATADERIPLLLETPAAVRWVSYEPALGPVDFEAWMRPRFIPTSEKAPWGQAIEETRRLDWVVVGGESGPGARHFDLAWANQAIAQGKAAGVPVFCKQLGAWPIRLVGKAFDSFQTWVNKASSWLVPGDLCIDTLGRVLHCGADFMRARDGGAFPVSIYERVPLRDRKGGDWSEWPADLRVREYPQRDGL
jgi:protein gp37